MTKAFYKEPSRVELNGVDVTHIMNVSIDTLNKRMQTLSCLDYNHDVEVEFGEYADGTLEFTPMHRAYGNDPATALDVLGFSLGHAEYDTTNDVITVIQTDNLDSDTGAACTERIVEVRQVEATASHAISDSGAADEAWAQSFVAGGEDIYEIKVKVYDSVGTPAEQFDVEVWTDDGGSPNKPNAQLASSNTVTVYASAGADSATSYYLGAGFTNGSTYADAVWETIDFSGVTNLTGSATLTIGTVYWLVFRNVGATADDDLFFAYTTNEWNDNGKALQDDDVDNSPVWGDSPANTKDLAFIMQFYTAEGLQLDFYDYSSATEGIHYTFKKVKCTNDSGLTVSPMQAAQGTLKWVSEDVTITSI